MATISACLIMKNEAKQNEFFKDKTNIDVCLSSLSKFCDEIIVVDTGSTDNSIEIAKQYTDKIFQFIENPFDFSNARNESFKKATKEWILWTDMDDYYSDENVEKILKLKPILDTTDSKYFSWYYDYRHFRGKCSYSFIRDRLLKNDNSFFWRYSIHEELVCNGKSTILEDVTTIHTCNHDNNVKYVEMFRKIEQHRELYPRELYYYGGELFVLGQIDKCLEVLKKFETTDYPGIYENKRTQDYIAKCYIKKGDCAKAKEHFLRYGAYDAFNRDVIYNIADCCFRMNDIEQAIFYYTIVTNIEFANNNLTKIDDESIIENSYLQLCVCYYRLGKVKESIEANNKALKLNPNNLNALANQKFFEKS